MSGRYPQLLCNRSRHLKIECIGRIGESVSFCTHSGTCARLAYGSLQLLPEPNFLTQGVVPNQEMAGHIQERGEPYTYQRAQPPQPTQLSGSEASTQGSVSSRNQANQHVDNSSQKPKLRTSCDGCQSAKLGCSQEKPTCRRCMRHDIKCVYSPFRRIGRPRKSTSTRPANGNGSKKSRSKSGDVDRPLDNIKIEDMPDYESEKPRISTFINTHPAPSSPASIGNGNGSWYPWTPDGDSLYSGFQTSFETHTAMMDEGDPFSNGTDYLDMGTSFDSHHNFLMDYDLSSREETMLDYGQSMQPTPPSSTTADMTVYQESMPEFADPRGLNILLEQYAQSQSPTSSGSPSPTSTRSVPGFNLRSTESSFAESSNPRNHGLNFRECPQKVANRSCNNRKFGPNPELTPPLSADSPALQNTCRQRCSSLLIQHLAFLESLLEARPSLDVILQAEKAATSLCNRVINCYSCTESKSCFLLFSMVIEHIMRLFETTPSGRLSDPCAMTLGSFEVDNDTKTAFLKRYLFSRLNRFADVLRDFRKLNDEGSENEYNDSTTADKVGDIYQRLESLRGNVEMWV